MNDKIVRRICSILLVLAILVIIAGATATYFDLNRYTPQLCCGWDKAFQLQPHRSTES